MKSLIGSMLTGLVMASNANADEFKRYSAYLDQLSLSDPKPAVANIAGGFGASDGAFYAAVSYTNYDIQTNVEGDDDGSIALGFGLGDPSRVALDTTVGITSVSTGLWGDGKFADEGNLSVKLHRRVAPLLGGDAASVAIGASNFAGWGGTTEIPTNYYGAYSEVLRYGAFDQYGVMYSVGYGTGISDGESEADVFYGLGWGYDDYSFSASRVGSETHLTGMLYFPSFPEFSVAVSQADAFNEVDARRMIVTVSYAGKLF